MLASNVPWQVAVTSFLITALAAILLELGSAALGLFGIAPYVASLLLAASLFLVVQNIPLLLNLSRSYFGLLIGLQGTQAVATIATFALYFHSAGVIDNHGALDHTLRDSLYFSINTWTTFGVPDLIAQPAQRLLTSVESIFGILSVALFTAMLWLWCSENMLPKERALFDGNRRRRGDLTVHRMRIRTLTGADRNLKGEWVDPPRPGESYRHDPIRKEWVLVESSSELKEGDSILDPDQGERL